MKLFIYYLACGLEFSVYDYLVPLSSVSDEAGPHGRRSGWIKSAIFIAVWKQSTRGRVLARHPPPIYPLKPCPQCPASRWAPSLKSTLSCKHQWIGPPLGSEHPHELLNPVRLTIKTHWHNIISLGYNLEFHLVRWLTYPVSIHMIHFKAKCIIHFLLIFLFFAHIFYVLPFIFLTTFNVSVYLHCYF